MSPKHTNQTIFIIIFLALTVITLFAYKKTASFFGFAKTIKSVNKTPCGSRGIICCSNSLVKDDYGYINIEKSYYCTEAQTRCWQKGSNDYQCAKLEDACGTSVDSPCCHDNSCRNRTDLTCVKGNNYNNPWWSQKRPAPRGPDNPQLSFGTCFSVNPQITVTPGGPECGKKGGPCCPVNKCDYSDKNICLYKDNQKQDSSICEDRSKAILKVYYANEELNIEYKELTDNSIVFINNNDRFLRITASTNVINQRQISPVVYYDRVFMFACNYHSDSDYKFLKDQPGGFWGNDSLTFCEYKDVVITKPITIAVKMYMMSPLEEPNPNQWPFVEQSPYFKQEI